MKDFVQIYYKQSSTVKKECVKLKELHELLEVKTAYRHWVKRHVFDVKNYADGFDYWDDKWVSLLVAQQLCRRAATEPGKKAALFLDLIYLNKDYQMRPTCTFIRKEYMELRKFYKENGATPEKAIQRALEKLRASGIDMEILFPQIFKRAMSKSTRFKIAQMGKILDLKPKEIISILCDMSVLAKEPNSKPRTVPRTRIYCDNTDTVRAVTSLLFCPETLVMIEIKKFYEVASYWDVLGKRPIRVSKAWLSNSKAVEYLGKHNITLIF